MLDTLRSLSWKMWILIVGGTAAVLMMGFGAYAAGSAWMAWRNIERVTFNLDAANAALVEQGAGSPYGFLSTDYDTVLVIGSDNRPDEYIGDQEDAYADAVLLYLAPRDGSSPMLVSIPRDLQVEDPCTGTSTKLNRTLEPCDPDISDIEHVGLTVQGYTGVAIENVALLDLAGFVDVIDTIGGVTLCSDHALREEGQDLLPAGCTTVDGATALAWVRSRKTQEFVDGEWRFVEGVGDSTRNERQKQLLLALLDELGTVRSPTALTSLLSEMNGAVRLGDTFTMTDAVRLAWDLKGRSGAGIRLPIIPVEPGVDADGSYIVIATTPFLTVIEGG